MVDQVGIGDFWGSAGPRNTFHRNRVGHPGIFLQDHSNWQNITANVLNTTTSKELRWDETIDPETQIIHQNLQNGSMQLSDAVPENAVFPNSCYHVEKPAFYYSLSWPSIGPDVATQTNPAEQRVPNGLVPAFN